MSSGSANWAYAEEFVPEDEVLLRARDAADHLGCVPILPGAGALLLVLTRALGARNVVEIGTGAGVSGTLLLRGMDPQGVLTTIDMDPENHKAARATFAAAGFGPERVRMITGRALDVLPRLTDGGYDLVFADARKQEYPAYAEHALRLLRPGGMVVFDNALWHSRVADPAQRDPDTTAVRETLKLIRSTEGLTVALAPSGDGLLAAIKD
nr:MAG: methyltransferase [Actinomycetota bacterium]